MGIPVLILSGSMGTGKTTVLGEISDLLRERGSSHATLDLDALCQVWPPVRHSSFNEWIGIENLRCVWANFATAEVERLVIARVVPARDMLARYQTAVPGAELTVCRLVASPTTMQARLRVRDQGRFQAYALRRALELAAELETARAEDFVVDNDQREVGEVAEEVLRKAGWD